MRRSAWSTCAVLLALARGAGAQEAPPASQAAPPPFPTAELDYRMAAGLACPAAEELRAETAKQIHYDPFAGGPGVPVGRFHVVVSRERPGVVLVKVSFD